MSEVSNGGLAKKLCLVMGKAGYVQKSGFNEKSRYKYATEADVLAMLRKELAEVHVFVFPSVISTERSILYKSQAGNEMHVTDVMVKWTFMDGESGETMECNMPGCGADIGDKGLYKAITGSSKYLFLKAFMLPTGDDPEEEAADKADAKTAQDQYVKEKLNSKAAGESLVFRPDGFGLTFLDGLNGIAILRANLSPEQTKLVQRINNTWAIPDQYAETFYKIAAKEGVKVSIGTGSPANGAAQAGSAKAVGTPAESAPTSLPIIKSAEVTGEGNKRRLVVRVAEGSLSNQYACWEQHLWPILIAGTNQTCALVLKENPKNPKYINIVDVAKIGDRSYENGKPIPTMNDPAKGFTASDDDLPEGMFE